MSVFPRFLFAAGLSCLISTCSAGDEGNGPSADDTGDSGDPLDTDTGECFVDGYGSTAAGSDDCDDTRATVYPGAEEIWSDSVLNDCDGDSAAAEAACPSIDSLSDATVHLLGECYGHAAGSAIKVAGDVIGAWYATGDEGNSGAVYLLSGGAVFGGL